MSVFGFESTSHEDHLIKTCEKLNCSVLFVGTRGSMFAGGLQLIRLDDVLMSWFVQPEWDASTHDVSVNSKGSST